ncbi:hypothetical protein L249_8497 [Ophiocordyceps polyrhachis-furcata BCC 54312]|uniref:Peroxin 20 n=1 Tax=Ophiocordyceps polyrhachis-furcata BCC 54312 TaxID=1330021 RepID=A0A367L6Q4_9HYPO|nr:hypothetical protein L249_8497 [Ophiocordyceps polyrhachis-furcata BCC 54312]
MAAEASCSGATPFKRLVDHQSRDVSHHQDRIVGRAGSNTSFRSLPNPSASSHDGFGSFLHSRPGPVVLPTVSHDAADRLTVHAAALQPNNPIHFTPAVGPDLSDWSVDFRRFSAQQQQQQQQHQQHQRPTTHATQPPSTTLSFQPTFLHQPGLPFAPVLDQRNVAPESDFDREMARWVASHGEGVMRQVDAAMDQFAHELEQSESAHSKISTTVTEPETRLTDLETPEIGNLSLRERPTEAIEPHREQHPESLPSEDAAARDKSAVSEAAERLLETVQHENGDKWQNSVFLSLMRDFRDGRKDIVENEIRQTGGDDDGTDKNLAKP